MSRTVRKNRISVLLRRKSVLAVNLALVVLVSWGLAGEYLRNRSMNKEIERLRARARSLEVQNLEVAKLTERFSGTEAVEREARLKLGLQKPGESVIIVQDGPPPPASAQQGPAGSVTDQTGASNARKWLDYFFSKR